MELNYYQSEIEKLAFYSQTARSQEIKFIYPALGLCGEAGEVAEKIKKIIRDKDCVFDESSKLEIKKELGDVLFYVSELSRQLGISLEDVAATNISKLNSRKDRGVLHGSGDNR